VSSILEWIGVAAGSGGLGALLTKVADAWAKKRQTEAEAGRIDAEAAQLIAHTAVTLVAPLQAQVEALSARVDHLETQNAETTTKLQIAIDYIRGLRSWIFTHIPDKTPPPTPLALEIG